MMDLLTVATPDSSRLQDIYLSLNPLIRRVDFISDVATTMRRKRTAFRHYPVSLQPGQKVMSQRRPIQNHSAENEPGSSAEK
jgi:hypothetical protein